jgi:hypothetical protein
MFIAYVGKLIFQAHLWATDMILRSSGASVPKLACGSINIPPLRGLELAPALGLLPVRHRGLTEFHSDKLCGSLCDLRASVVNALLTMTQKYKESLRHFLSRIFNRSLLVFACTVGWYISSARAGATRNSPGTWTRIAYWNVALPSK